MQWMSWPEYHCVLLAPVVTSFPYLKMLSILELRRPAQERMEYSISQLWEKQKTKTIDGDVYTEYNGMPFVAIFNRLMTYDFHLLPYYLTTCNNPTNIC